MERRLRAEPIAKDLLYMKVAEAIGRYLQAGGLKPGDKLPPERTLAKEFATGRNTVRDALRALEREGVLEIRKGAGAFVKSEYPNGGLQLKLMRVNYRDLLQIKIWLERLAIQRAAEKAAPHQTEALGALARELLALAERGEFSLAADRRFHRKLLECAGSETLSQLVMHIIDALDGYAGYIGGVSTLWLKTVPYHLELAEALAGGNLALALAAHEYIHALDLDALEAMAERPKAEEASSPAPK